MTNTSEPMSAPAAATYQQLRAHLAALKLTTAAEHLSSVLDAAKKEKLTITAALDRLMALEVDADATAAWLGAPDSRACPPQRRWPTSTSMPHPAWTKPSSMTWPPDATWNQPPT